MHVFLLILAIAGQPERVKAICETYKQCSDKGAEIANAYIQATHKLPESVTYRVIPAVIVPEGVTT